MSFFHQISDIPEKELFPGILAKLVHTPGLTIGHIRLLEGAILPEHHHFHEQVTNVLEGALEMTIDGHTRVCLPGEVVTIPSNTPHSARALKDCLVIDVFRPARDDYK